MMKKMMGLLVSVCMIFSLTACGGQDSSSSRSSESPASKDETEEPLQEASGQPEEVQTETPVQEQDTSQAAEAKPGTASGKTVIPFCTSASSGLGQSGELLEQAAGSGNWLKGERFSSGVSENVVLDWVNSLGQQ